MYLKVNINRCFDRRLVRLSVTKNGEKLLLHFPIRNDKIYVRQTQSIFNGFFKFNEDWFQFIA